MAECIQSSMDTTGCLLSKRFPYAAYYTALCPQTPTAVENSEIVAMFPIRGDDPKPYRYEVKLDSHTFGDFG